MCSRSIRIKTFGKWTGTTKFKCSAHIAQYQLFVDFSFFSLISLKYNSTLFVISVSFFIPSLLLYRFFKSQRIGPISIKKLRFPGNVSLFLFFFVNVFFPPEKSAYPLRRRSNYNEEAPCMHLLRCNNRQKEAHQLKTFVKSLSFNISSVEVRMWNGVSVCVII